MFTPAGGASTAASTAGLLSATTSLYPTSDRGFVWRASQRNLLKRLINRGGWDQWDRMVRELRLLSASYAACKEFLCQHPCGTSNFVKKHLHWVRPVYVSTDRQAADSEPDFVNMFRFTRLCWRWQRASCPKEADKCTKMHICRDWIAGLCAAGPNCARRHSFERTCVSELAIPTTWSSERVAEFVRGCHPSPCPAYNSARGCTDADCHSLHVCAAFLVGQCTDPAVCVRSHDLSATQSSDVLTFFTLNMKVRFPDYPKKPVLIMPLVNTIPTSVPIEN